MAPMFATSTVLASGTAALPALLPALVLVPQVSPLCRVKMAVLAPLAGAVRRTTIWSPLLTMACCTQAPPFT